MGGPVSTGEGAVVETGGARDFASAARQILVVVKDRLHLDVANLGRRQGELCQTLDQIGWPTDDYGPGHIGAYAQTFSALREAGGPAVVRDIALVPEYRELAERRGFACRGLFTVPLRNAWGNILGSLSGFSREPFPPIADELTDSLSASADLLGLILSQELRVDNDSYRLPRTHRPGELDAVTGFGNRRYWDRLLSLEDTRCRHYGSAAAVIRLDLPASGLARAGAVLAAVLPPGVHAARLGEGELGLVATEHDANDTEELAAMLAIALEDVGLEAVTGSGVRQLDSSMLTAWHDADMARAKAPAEDGRPPLTRPRRPRAPRPGGRLDALLTSAISATGNVDELLELTRQHLDTDVVTIGERRGGIWSTRRASSRLPGWRTGLEVADEESLCGRMIAGRIAEAVPDVANLADGPDMSWSPTPIGSWAGVPLHLGRGESAGVLTSFSTRPDRSLGRKDVAFLRLVARFLEPILAGEEHLALRQRRAVSRVEQAQVPGALEIVYQPIAELASGRVVGVEALTRLPGLAGVTPAGLFEAAEEAGVLVAMELHTATLALEQGLGEQGGFLALNFSASTLLDPGFERFVDGLPVERLIVELSEHTRVEDYEAVHTVLAPLRGRGLLLAVDDTGAGFASFHHVLRLRPDIIKLDISLVRDVAADEINQSLAASLAAVGHQIGALVVAEGIEDAAALDVLRSIGVDYGQGYHLARPGPLG